MADNNINNNNNTTNPSSDDRVSTNNDHQKSSFPLRRVRLGSQEPATLSKRKVWSKAMAMERVLQVIGTDDTHLDLAMFDRRELLLGKTLGRGSFSVVEEITSICFLANSSSFSSNHRQEIRLREEERNFLAEHCLRPSSNGRPSPRYALKRLQKNGDWNGVADLVIESHFLRRLQHPNLIKIRAVAMGDMYHLDLFLVLDRLYCTLQVKLRQWKRDEGNWWNCRQKSNMGERLIAAYHLGSALHYLHEQRICHRDIKPENCGFDIVSISIAHSELIYQCTTLQSYDSHKILFLQ